MPEVDPVHHANQLVVDVRRLEPANIEEPVLEADADSDARHGRLELGQVGTQGLREIRVRGRRLEVARALPDVFAIVGRASLANPEDVSE